MWEDSDLARQDTPAKSKLGWKRVCLCLEINTAKRGEMTIESVDGDHEPEQDLGCLCSTFGTLSQDGSRYGVTDSWIKREQNGWRYPEGCS